MRLSLSSGLTRNFWTGQLNAEANKNRSNAEQPTLVAKAFPLSAKHTQENDLTNSTCMDENIQETNSIPNKEAH